MFGIMGNRWRVFLTLLLLSPQSVENVVLTALVLHNNLRSSSSRGCTALLEQLTLKAEMASLFMDFGGKIQQHSHCYSSQCRQQAIMPQLMPNLYGKP